MPRLRIVALAITLGAGLAAVAPAPTRAQAPMPNTLPKLEEAQARILQIPFDAQGQVSQSSAAILSELAREVASQPLTRITVRGYTDPEGASAAVRKRMALQRALSVRQFLASQGLPSERINVRGVGRDIYGIGPAERAEIVVTPPLR